MPGWCNPTKQSHYNRKHHRRNHDARRHPQTEHRFAECYRVVRSRGHPIERHHQNNPHHRPQQRQQHRFENKRRHNARTRKTNHPQRRNFARAVSHRRIHRIHRRKARSDPHNDRYQCAYELDGVAAIGLLRPILGLQHAVQLQSLIVIDPVLQRIRRNRIRRPNQYRVKRGPVEVRRQLIDVTPDFRVVGRAASIKDAHHIPRPFTDPNALADIRLRKPAVNRFADHNLVLPRSEPSSCHQLHFRRIAIPVGVKNRTVTFVSPVPSFLGNTTTSKSSPETSGCPCASRATPGSSFIIGNESRSTPPAESSAVAPLRNTSTFSGSPLPLNAAFNPASNAIIKIAVVTVSAIPSAVITVALLRSFRFRMLYWMGTAIFSPP